MEIIDRGQVRLKEGEPVPFACACGWLYQPALGSARSVCPSCGRENEHASQEWERRKSHREEAKKRR